MKRKEVVMNTGEGRWWLGIPEKEGGGYEYLKRKEVFRNT